jgi:tRNA pseudouridine-54 N-methylase
MRWTSKVVIPRVIIFHGVNFQWDDDDDDVRFVLGQHTELDSYSASSLKQQSLDRHVASLGHIILIPSQPVVALCP